MHRRVVGARLARALVVAALGVVGASAHAAPWEYLAPSAAVVRVQVVRVDGASSVGSGVVVGAERVVTSCHVTRGAKQVLVVRNEKSWPVRALAAQPQRDLCLLDTPGLAMAPATLAHASDLHAGDTVAAIGFSLGLGLQITEGAITAMHRFDGSHVFQTSTAFTSGASGGGLFDDKGRLVGVLTFRLPARGPFYFAVPSDWIDAAAPTFEPIATQSASPGFWETGTEAWPRFLQATSLVAARRWDDLDALAARWLADEPDSAEAHAWRERAHGER